MPGPAIGGAGLAEWPGEPGSPSTAAQAEARSRPERATAGSAACLAGSSACLAGSAPLRLAGATETFVRPATSPPRDSGPVLLGLRCLWDGRAQRPGWRVEVRARPPRVRMRGPWGLAGVLEGSGVRGDLGTLMGGIVVPD